MQDHVQINKLYIHTPLPVFRVFGARSGLPRITYCSVWESSLYYNLTNLSIHEVLMFWCSDVCMVSVHFLQFEWSLARRRMTISTFHNQKELWGTVLLRMACFMDFDEPCPSLPASWCMAYWWFHHTSLSLGSIDIRVLTQREQLCGTVSCKLSS